MKSLTQAETSVHFQTDIITSFSVTFGTFFVMKSLQAATSNERHDFRVALLTCKSFFAFSAADFELNVTKPTG